MPVVSGDLSLVTARPESVSEVWVRAPRVRTTRGGVVTGSSDRVPVQDGRVEFECLPGPAVLSLVSHGAPREVIPILVGDGGAQTLDVVVLAAEAADGATRDALEELAARAVAAVSQAEVSASAASKFASGAASSASQAKASAQAASTAEKNAKAAQSGAQSAQSEAKKSASAAAASASSAKSDAGQARSSASSAAESAAAAKTSEGVAEQRAAAADEAAKAVERVGTAQALGVEDLNDVTAQGVYSQDRDGNASTGRHYPVSRAGLLEVFNPPVGAQVYQRYTTYGDYQDVYVRGSQTGSWGSWKKLSQDGHTHGISDVVGLEARFATSPYNSITVKTEGKAQALSGLRKGDYVHVLDTGNVYIWE